MLYRPLAVVVGGAKVKDKIGVLKSVIERADVLIVGGRMAFTFLAAQGVSVGSTHIEETWLEVRVLDQSSALKVRVSTPITLFDQTLTSDVATIAGSTSNAGSSAGQRHGLAPA